jgi:hypothetical protein
MRALQLIFNELSTTKLARDRFQARDWMRRLYDTAATLIRFAEIEYVLLVVSSFPQDLLASDYSFSDWLDDSEVEWDLREALQSLVTWGPYVDDFILDENTTNLEVQHDGNFGLGLTLAICRDHGVVSIDVSPFQEIWLPTMVAIASKRTERAVYNFFNTYKIETHFMWLASRASVRPRYKHAHHHDPSSGIFRGGGALTSIIPDDAQSTFEQSVPAEVMSPGSTWWAMNADGYLYRYAGGIEGGIQVVHWNGTTDQYNSQRIEDNEIPERIRQFFPKRRQN